MNNLAQQFAALTLRPFAAQELSILHSALHVRAAQPVQLGPLQALTWLDQHFGTVPPAVELLARALYKHWLPLTLTDRGLTVEPLAVFWLASLARDPLQARDLVHVANLVIVDQRLTLDALAQFFDPGLPVDLGALLTAARMCQHDQTPSTLR